VALIDFGISHQIAEILDTAAQPIAGTPYYMNPEQALGQPTDERTDLYALGVILYQMLTGEKPFCAETPLAVIYKHANEPAPGLPGSLAHLQSLQDTLLAKRPSDRPASAAEVVAHIDEILARAAA